MSQRTMKQPKNLTNSSGLAERRYKQILLSSLLCLASWMLVACGPSNADNPAPDAPLQIRTPHPTFTPTAVTAGSGQIAQPTATLSLAVPLTTPISAAIPITSSSPPASVTDASPALTPKTTEAKTKVKAIVNTPLVNIRSGPSTDFEILATVDRGQEYEIVGKNAKGDWWKVCCIDDKPGWVSTELVDTDGAVDSVLVAKADAQAATVAPTSEPTAQAASTEPTAAPATTVANQPVTSTTPANTFAFTLITQEQFPEPKLVRVYLYAYDGDGNALEGYSVHVTKDGAAVPVTATSFGGRPGFTWPVADVRQRFQNMKVEFPGVEPAGTWVVQLVKDGKPVGPPATFPLKANEPNQELYVRYEQHK
jgi:uncharacterized protein YraI